MCPRLIKRIVRKTHIRSTPLAQAVVQFGFAESARISDRCSGEFTRIGSRAATNTGSTIILGIATASAVAFEHRIAGGKRPSGLVPPCGEQLQQQRSELWPITGHALSAGASEEVPNGGRSPGCHPDFTPTNVSPLVFLVDLGVAL